METSLHKQLKQMYAADESQIEQKVGRFFIDAVRGEELIEVQFSSLSAINSKIRTLVNEHKVRVVKPLVIEKQLVRCASKGGSELSRRRSPKRGQILDIFDELIYFTRVFPHKNLVLEVPLIRIEEWSYPTPKSKKRRRRPPKKYTVEDQMLVEVFETHVFRKASDLTKLIPKGSLPETFDTAQLAKALDTKRWIAQKVAYCLKHMKAIEEVGKKGNAILYKLARPQRKRTRRPAKAVS